MKKKPTYEELEKEVSKLRRKIAEFEPIIDRNKNKTNLQADLTALIENTDDIIVFRDLEGRILFKNEAFKTITRRLFGVEVETGMSTTDLLPPDKKKYWEDVLSRVLRGERIREEFSYTFDNGDIRHYDISFNPVIKDGKIVGCSEINRDVTERKNTEEALLKSQKMSARTEHIAHIGSWEWEISTDTVTWSDELFQIFKLDPNDGAPSWAEHPKLYHPEDFKALQKAVEVALKNGTPYEIELRAFRKNGETCVCMARGFAELGENENPVRLFGSLHDITDRKQAEEKLRDSEALFRDTFERSSIGKALTAPNGRLLKVNQAFADMLGYTKEEMQQLDFETITHPDDTDKSWKGFRSVLSGENDVFRYKKRYIHKNKKIIWADINVNLLRNTQGKPLYCITGIIDITKSVMAEEAIRESEKKFRLLFDNSPIGKTITYVSGEMLSNNTLAEMLGYSLDEFRNFKWQDITHPDDLELSQHIIEQVISGKKEFDRFTKRYIHKNGSVIWADVSTRLQRDSEGNSLYLITAVVDITELKRIENELRQSQKELQITLNATADGIWSWNFKTNELFFSSKYYKMLGYQPNEFPANYENWVNLIHPDDRERALAVANEFLKKKPEIYENEFRLRTKNGDYRWARTVAKVVEKDEHGDAVYMIGNHEDITEKKFALDAFIEERERFELAMRSVNDGLWDWNLKTNEIYYSPVWKKLLGYEDHEIENKFSEWERLTHPDDIKISWGILNEVLEGRRNSFENEFKMHHKDGHWVDILARADVIFDENGEGTRVIGTHVDITERKRLEAQLLQAQKMESIGTLAGGIAHDFNNILFPIVGHAEMLLEDVSEDSPLRESLKEIYTGSLRARELVHQILAFSRQGSSELKMMKMQPIIKEALKLIRSTIPTTLSINQNLQPNCGAVKADPTQIHQIIMNLTTNAYHAMEETEGELKVSLKEIELGQYDFINSDMSPGLYACLTIADTGTGMDKKTIDKIFDPFFTTKEKGKGTGMGLSMVHGIVKNMNGEIQVHSEPGKGTQFHIYLPIVKNGYEKQETQTNGPIQGGNENVLLVDDEEGIIAMGKQALERLGYHVTSRISSIEALEAFRANPGKFDLVITDKAMPKMPGDKLAAELMKIRPDIPILLCTGFSESMTEEKIRSLGIKGLLLKPIIIKDLAKKMRELLDKKNEN